VSDDGRPEPGLWAEPVGGDAGSLTAAEVAALAAADAAADAGDGAGAGAGGWVEVPDPETAMPAELAGLPVRELYEVQAAAVRRQVVGPAWPLS
jgi:hypothetical protein